MNAFMQKLSAAWKSITQTTEQKLGVPKGFPVKICVGLSPETHPPGEFATSSRYLVATYKGNDVWKVEDQIVEPEEMASAVYNAGRTRSMNTSEVIAEFDKQQAAFPSQDYIAYEGASFNASTRAQLATLVDSVAAKKTAGINLQQLKS